MPPEYPRFYFHKYYGNIGLASVALVVEAANGPNKGHITDLYTTQEALVARMPPALRAVAGDRWGDDEAFAEAAALLDAVGGILVARCPHGEAVDRPCGACTATNETPPDPEPEPATPPLES